MMLYPSQRLDNAIQMGNYQSAVNILSSMLTKHRNSEIHDCPSSCWVNMSIGKLNETALHVACLVGNDYVAAQLIDLGANINAKNEYGHTPLIKAARHGHGKLIHTLVKAGASLFLQDKRGKNALDWAIFSADDDCVQKLRKVMENEVGIKLSESKRKLRTLCDTTQVPDDNTEYEQNIRYDGTVEKNLRESIVIKDQITHDNNGIDFALLPCTLGCGKLKRRSQMEYHTKYKCSNRSMDCNLCGSRVKVIDIPKHENDECPKRIVRCPLSSKGCASFMTWDEVNRHITHTCELRQYSCEKCQHIIPFNEKTKHEKSECPFRTIKCSICDVFVEANNMKFHSRNNECRHLLIKKCNIERGTYSKSTNVIDCEENKCEQPYQYKGSKRFVGQKMDSGHFHDKQLLSHQQFPLDKEVKEIIYGIHNTTNNNEEKILTNSLDDNQKNTQSTKSECPTMMSTDTNNKEGILCEKSQRGCVPKLRTNENVHPICVDKIAHCPIGSKLQDNRAKINVHIQDCSERFLSCPNNCNSMIKSKELTDHVNRYCPLRRISCEVCLEEIIASNKEIHNRDECQFRLILCPLSCGLSIAFKDSEAHMEKLCKKRLVICDQCGDDQIFANELNSHKNGSHSYYPCPMSTKECQSCKTTVLLGNWTKHIQEVCPFREVSCRTCSEIVPFSDLDDHALTSCVYKEHQRNIKLASLDQKDPLVECQLCFQQYVSSERLRHLNDTCPKRYVQCSHGCTEKVRAEDIVAHEHICKKRYLSCGISTHSCNKKLQEWATVDLHGNFKLNNCEKHNDNALMWAIQNDDHKIVRYFLDKMHSLVSILNILCHENKFGETPLLLASRIGNSKFVRLILEKAAIFDKVAGSDFSIISFINKENSRGSTALIEAARGCSVEVINTLVSFYASANYVSKAHHKSALDWARKCNVKEKVLNEIQYVSDFENDIKDIFICINIKDHTKLKGILDQYIILNQNTNTIVESQSECNLFDSNLKVMGQECAQKKCLRMTSYVSHNGFTPLSWASAIGNTEAVEIFLDYGFQNGLGDEFQKKCASLIQLVFRNFRRRNSLNKRNVQFHTIRAEQSSNKAIFNLALKSLIIKIKARKEFVRMPLTEALFNGHHEVLEIFKKRHLSLHQFGLIGGRKPCGMIPRHECCNHNDISTYHNNLYQQQQRNIQMYLVNCALSGKSSFETASWEYGIGWQPSGTNTDSFLTSVLNTLDASDKLLEATANILRQKIVTREKDRCKERINICRKEMSEAIQNGDFKKMIYLSLMNESEINLDFETEGGLTPLIRATENAQLFPLAGGKIWYDEISEYVSPVSYLLDRAKPTPSIDYESQNLGHTALTYACVYGNLQSVKELLDRGANINRQILKLKMTPLMFAASQGHVNIVTLLLEKNADTKLMDNNGKTAEDFAFQNHREDVLSILAREKRNCSEIFCRVRKNENIENSTYLIVEDEKKTIPCLLGCDYRGTNDNVKIHCQKECKWRLIQCTFCGEQLHAFELDDHMRSKCQFSKNSE